MKTTLPHGRFPRDSRRAGAGKRISLRERFGVESRANANALIDFLPVDLRIAILAEACLIVTAVFNYSQPLGTVLYALAGATLVVSTVGESA